MIIDKEGNILQAFWAENGIIVHHHSLIYGIDFAVCLYYDEDQKLQAAAMRKLKDQLSATDYQAIKYSDGAITEEEYAPIREERQKWRDLYNEIEAAYEPPTITEEEIIEAEAIAMENYRERYPDGEEENNDTDDQT